MSGEGDNTSVYIYNGVGDVPNDVTHVRVDPTVTIIPERAFGERRNLEVVELPEGLIEIEESAFSDCESLKRINIPSSVKKIGKQAFFECNQLDGIILPDGLEQLDERLFQWCKSLKKINIPRGIKKVIGEAALCNCGGLTDIIFSEGLQEIKKDAFSRCESLVSVTLPSSLKSIGVEAFEGCKVLNEVHMPDTIEIIQARAFQYCNFTNFRMPLSLGNAVDISIVGRNSCLVSLELPESVEQLKDQHNRAEDYTDLESLRNVALPSNCVVVTDAFHDTTDLGLALLDDGDNNVDTIREAIQYRFDDLPIHKICYYQSYHDTETTMQSLRREINPWTSKFPGQLNTTGKEQDCLGMTPLHILACSTKPTIEMYQLLIDKYPKTLIMTDKWDDIPLLYALWCNAPADVIELLVESYKSLHPDYEFNWSGMLLTLAKRDVPLSNIQKLITTQQNNFPDQKYDMQQVVMELAAFDIRQARWTRTSMETFKYLLQRSITKRLDSLGIAKWRKELENSIASLPVLGRSRDRDTQTVYNRLASYESIKEGTSVLELALWKAKTDMNRDKRAKVDSEISYREQCRINCGADIIIRNVLPYLV